MTPFVDLKKQRMFISIQNDMICVLLYIYIWMNKNIWYLHTNRYMYLYSYCVYTYKHLPKKVICCHKNILIFKSSLWKEAHLSTPPSFLDQHLFMYFKYLSIWCLVVVSCLFSCSRLLLFYICSRHILLKQKLFQSTITIAYYRYT